MRDESNLSTQTVDVKVAHRDAIDEYLSFGTVVEAGQEVDEGGFAGTRRAYDGEGLPAGDVEVDVAEHVNGVGVAVGAIGKGDVAVLYGCSEALEDDGVVFFNDAFVGVHNFEDAGCGGVGFLEVVVDTHDGLHGWHKAGKEDDEEHEDRGKQFALDDSEATENEDKGEAHGEQHFGEGTAEFAAGSHVYHTAGIGGVGLVELAAAALFVGEGFNGADA